MKEPKFLQNAYYERLIELRREQPDVFSTLSPAARLALSYYECQKRRQALLYDELTRQKPA